MYKGIRRIVYAADLADSSKYVTKEIETDTQQLADISNVKIEVVPNVLRKEAEEVLKNWHRKNAKSVEKSKNNQFLHKNQRKTMKVYVCDWQIKK